jgi:hypothetical protein
MNTRVLPLRVVFLIVTAQIITALGSISQLGFPAPRLNSKFAPHPDFHLYASCACLHKVGVTKVPRSCSGTPHPNPGKYEIVASQL